MFALDQWRAWFGLRQGLDNMLADKNIRRPLNLVAHGFITGGAQRRPLRPLHSPMPKPPGSHAHDTLPVRGVLSAQPVAAVSASELRTCSFDARAQRVRVVPAGQYAATWALKHPEAVSKLVLIDMPLDKEVCLVPSRDAPPRLLCCRALLLGCDMPCGVCRVCSFESGATGASRGQGGGAARTGQAAGAAAAAAGALCRRHGVPGARPGLPVRTAAVAPVGLRTLERRRQNAGRWICASVHGWPRVCIQGQHRCSWGRLL